ncbi:hypothetical protein MXL95_22765 [Escherichia coli]|nr:hypothetical protein [Escherichia coli]
MIMFTPWLTPIVTESDHTEANALSYEALTPIELDADKAGCYISALNYAYEHPDIRNIAVTGPYGAGKSSVLKTWCKVHNTTLRVLTISLADFDMQRHVDESNAGSTSDEGEKNTGTVEKSIEYSILQQILYKNKKHELPCSRIDRISDVTVGQIFRSASFLTGTVLLSGAALFFLAPDYVTAKLSLPETLARYFLERPFEWRLSGAVVSVMGALCLLLKQLHRIGIFDRKVSLDKVDLLKGAVTTRVSSPSLLNVYIDEIVYFFDSTKYDVVIFEDLDRFNNGRIFVKLREINQIINNYLSDRKPVKFIYAVRDGIFNSAESRTKFFDFVMPVIPVMDEQNAYEHFVKKFKEEEINNNLSECISRIATFIPNMRVMHNITNEFRLYQNLVNSRENLAKLLAMIAYKNLCVEDYHGIDSKKGVLYHFIKSYIAHEIQNELLCSVNNELEDMAQLLESIKNEKNVNRESLREELLMPYLSKAYSDILVFWVEGRQITLDVAIKNEEYFLMLLDKGNISINFLSNNQRFIRLNKQDIEPLKIQYKKRCNLIDNKTIDNITKIKNRISGLELLKTKILSGTVSDIAEKMTNEGFISWIKKKEDTGVLTMQSDHEQIDFIFFLLASGYLSTDYMSYRSIFIPGGLSETDNLFLKDVMSGKDPEKTFSLHLDNVNNIVARLKKLGVLQRDNAQHPAVIGWLLDNEPDTLKNNIIALLSQTDSRRVVSLLMLIQNDFATYIRLRYLDIFMSDVSILNRLLTHLWASEERTQEQQVFVQKMAAHLLCLTERTSVWQSAEINKYISKLTESSPLLITAVPEGYGDAFVEVLKKNALSVSHIPDVAGDEKCSVIRKIAGAGLFKYSVSNLKNIYLSLMQNKNEEITSFSLYPFYCLGSLKIPEVTDILWANIDDFILSVYIESDEIDRVPELLNSHEISMRVVEQIIAKMDFCIHQLDNIINRSESSGSNIYSMLLQYGRILPSFNNFVHLLHDNAVNISGELVPWVNDKYAELKPSAIVINNTGVFDSFVSEFICSPELSGGALLKVLNNLNTVIIDVPEKIPLRNAELLCSEKKLAPTVNVFTGLFNALSGNVDDVNRMNTLLADLIARRPEIISQDPDDIFYIEGDFDKGLAGELFRHKLIDTNIKVGALRWLRVNNPGILEKVHLLSLNILAELSPWMNDDSLRLTLLKRCLVAGRADKDTLCVVLNSFDDENYHGLLPHDRFRKIPHTSDVWEVAELISHLGFIQPPKMGTGRDEHKIVITPTRYVRDEAFLD